MSVRELFNEQLKGAEIIPGDAFEEKLMRKLSVREFLRFIPSKFNIYYLVGLVVVGVVTGLLLLPHYLNNKELPFKSIVPDTIQIDNLKQQTISAATEGALYILNKESLYQILTEKTPELTISQNVPIIEKNVNANIENKVITLTHSELSPEISGTALKSAVVENTEDVKAPVAQFNMSSAVGCLPVKIKFANTSVNFDSCYWTFGDGGSSVLANPEWIFDEEGIFKIVLTVFNKDGLKSIAVDSLIVYPKPRALFEISPEDVIIPEGEVHFLNFSSYAVSFQWDFGDGEHSNDYEPDYRYKSNGRYNLMLIASSEYGCADTLIIENAFSGSSNYITFPNAFIPNTGGPTGGFYSSKSDEAAQVFHPVTSGVSVYQLRIFSKRGILIFESNDIAIGWDGYYKSQLCDPGVFIWKVRGKLNNGEPFVKMGDVILLKN